jgi:uncharacterized protein (TIGR02246 family)
MTGGQIAEPKFPDNGDSGEQRAWPKVRRRYCDMRRNQVKLVLFLAPVAALVLAATGCQQPAPQVTDTRAADEAAIRAVADDQLKAVAAMDAAKAVSGYTDDAVLMSPDAPLIRGKADVQKTLEAMLKDKPEFSMDAPKIEVAKSGDVAYEWVTGKTAVKDKKGKVTETGFKSLTAWKKQADGSWKMTVDTFIPDPPPNKKGK